MKTIDLSGATMSDPSEFKTSEGYSIEIRNDSVLIYQDGSVILDLSHGEVRIGDLVVAHEKTLSRHVTRAYSFDEDGSVRGVVTGTVDAENLLLAAANLSTPV